MKIERILISGFRGFRDKVDVPIAAGFTVIDGRNGVGKSTLFDAIEFALTGHISKYGDMKASGESVEDYIWWKGDGPSPSERFVEVTLRDGAEAIVLRRTPIEDPSPELLLRVEAGMVNAGMAPPSPLLQLCAASIIRDENIASLSLDLSETQRYAKLRQAIGAMDADAWAERGNRLASIARKRSDQAKADVVAANNAVAEANRKIDDARAALAPEAAITEASSTMSRLLQFGPTVPDQLISPGREFVAVRERYARDLASILSGWEEYESDSVALAESEAAIEKAKGDVEIAKADRDLLPEPAEGSTVGETAELVAQLHELRSIGTRIGLVEKSCPLCAADHDATSFAVGLAKAAETIERIDRQASELAAEATKRRVAIADAERRIAEAQKSLVALIDRTNRQRRALETRRLLLSGVGLSPNASKAEVLDTRDEVAAELEAARHALRVLSTLSQNSQLETGVSQAEEARVRLARAQDRAGRARRAETIASALHDAARRAGSETLDLRLERVLPLMAELYGRLRPHPVWQDIEYSIRGDLRRFLSLQVGDGLNPQFLFSSGQRRATGLAFLLSINLSLAWSRWRSILLDDPVQHVDDFRTVNLAEVLAQLVASGRQVIVAVEDAALAELLARRMPVLGVGEASRLTLALGSEGSSTVVRRNDPVPMLSNVLAA
ncbi:AAA family ATPase [Sphingobium sp. B2]|uniref:AAA family ATPase n=1 Tax=Sphingobium sp. B2 TaxID=2583228 RepID=UPI0011A9D8BF|nr:AAA family ATPase [Sphingobium sp. B2]